MTWIIDVTLVEEWLLDLDDDTYDQVIAGLSLLKQHGPSLGRPLVDSVRDSRHANMKELRPSSSGRSVIRILFAFDPARRAILLLGGDKRDQWRTWYQNNIPIADDRFDTHLENLEKSDG